MSNTPYRGHHAVQTKHRTPLFVILPITVLLVIAVIVVFLLVVKNDNSSAGEHFADKTVAITTDSSLVGTWIYDEYTRYEFTVDGSGQMLLDDTSYPFTYSVDGDQLHLDFADDVITDATYAFTTVDNQLTLQGGKGTIGGSYDLTKE